MQIRGKLLILLLVIALVPLGFSAALHQYALRSLANRLTADTRQLLDESARQLLQGKVIDDRRILERDQQILRLALDYQAFEVEQRLAARPPSKVAVYGPDAFDRSDPSLPGLHPSDRHYRQAVDGAFQPMPISREAQVMFLVGPPTPGRRDDLARLSTMTAAYRRISEVSPRLLFWQYTALENGIHSSYPGHGGYPDTYDPRQRSWYQAARSGRQTVRKIVTDATTGKPILTLSKPVHRPDGSFAGVTAIDVAYEQMFSDWNLPTAWQQGTDSLLVSLDRESGRIEILLRNRQEGAREDWQRPPEQEVFTSPDRAELQALQRDLLAGRSGVRLLTWHGQTSLVAYSPAMNGDPFPLVIIPLELLHAPARAMEIYLRSRVVTILEISASLLLGVVVWVVVTAFLRARRVTRPIKELATAAGQLAAGDYAVKVDITTGDELQSLGNAFNDVGPQLQEREALIRSLNVAREIQQLLLPKSAPVLNGFRIAGRTLYCDETGGDYFDYIPIDAERLAVVVGDVTGHGIGSALLMAAARGVLRSQATRGLEADRLLVDLNRHLVHDTADSLFMTLFYGLLDSKLRAFHWVSAGHGPAYHYRSEEGRFSELTSTGIPLGILGKAAYEINGPVHVAPGDLLLIGTDGIWEAQSPSGEMFGIVRLQQVVAAKAGQPAEEILDAVINAVGSFRGAAAQTDDLTLLVVQGVAGNESTGCA